MATVKITQIYSILSEKLGGDTAEELTSYIEDRIKDEPATKSNVLTTKIALAESKIKTIKWMFIFCMSLLAVTFGFILLFMKK